MVVVVGVGVLLGGPGMGTEPGTAQWWQTRPVWVAVLAAVTFALVAGLGRLENPPAETRPAPRTWQPLLATVAVCGGLAVMARSGIVGDDGVQWVWPLLPVAGLVATRVIPLRRRAAL